MDAFLPRFQFPDDEDALDQASLASKAAAPKGLQKRTDTRASAFRVLLGQDNLYFRVRLPKRSPDISVAYLHCQAEGG